jgi:hypothetical protein
LNVVAVYLDPPRTWEFLDGDRRVIRPLLGRDYQVAFGELEYRGDRFNLTAYIHRDQADTFESTVEARRAFQRLINLSREPLSYVAVLDDAGDRWFATLQADSGDWNGPFYNAHLRVTEVTARPSTPNVVAPGDLPQPPDEPPPDLDCTDPGGTIGYIGCSNSWMEVAGYNSLGGRRFWFEPPDGRVAYGGGTVSQWSKDPDGPDGNIYWDEFDRLYAAEGAPSVVWWNLCAHDLPRNSDCTPNTSASDLIYAQALEVLPIIRSRTNAIIYVSGINPYECVTPPFNGVNWAECQDVAERLAADAVSLGEDGTLCLGPVLVPLSADDTNDGTHPDADGRLAEGAVLLDFFG